LHSCFMKGMLMYTEGRKRSLKLLNKRSWAGAMYMDR
jgi:hypothetical protein